ncbi:MAG: hypothetical protein AB7G62_01450 [Magnetospirillum sp.]
MNRPLVFVADCVRFVWEQTLFAARWACLTLALYGLIVLLWLAPPGMTADTEAIFRLLGGLAALSLIAMGITGAFTGTLPFRLPPRWSTWIGQRQSRMETKAAAWWAKIPAWKQKAISIAFVGALSAMFIWMGSQAPERNPQMPPVISPRETVR